VISLLGGDAGAAPLASSKTEPAILVADPAAGQSMTEAARQALRRLDTLLADNSDSLHSAIANLNTFTAALARNSDRVDGILTGLEHMTGGGAPKAAPVSYDLTAPRVFPPPQKAAKSQIIIPEPAALVVLDTQRIVVDPGAGEPLENVQWSDTIPKLLQEKIIQSFEASNYVAAVAKPMEGLAADYQLLDLRSFQITGAAGGPTAHVEFAAKLLGEAGRIVGSQTFDAVVPARDVSAAGAAAALNEAFGKAVTELVTWAAGVI
jgi:phospholipid/cholesterol/gamma-HCH transport system substrate-binding protein